jgi:hypothetical protein
LDLAELYYFFKPTENGSEPLKVKVLFTMDIYYNGYNPITGIKSTVSYSNALF